MNIRVVNISFGATTFGEKENLIALEKAIEKLWDNNIIVVAAAGNEGPGRQTVAINVKKNKYTVDDLLFNMSTEQPNKYVEKLMKLGLLNENTKDNLF